MHYTNMAINFELFVYSYVCKYLHAGAACFIIAIYKMGEENIESRSA